MLASAGPRKQISSTCSELFVDDQRAVGVMGDRVTVVRGAAKLDITQVGTTSTMTGV
jgi:hypothetical protein